MFTMPAIHHPSAKVQDESMGTMHLNALNGSCNVLSSTISVSSRSPGHNGVFGSLIEASLSNNHPYRPQDSGMTFHETAQSSRKKIAPTTPFSKPSNPSAQDKSSSLSLKLNSKRKGSSSSLGTPETEADTGPRRRSLDLEFDSTNSHRRCENRAVSLDELVIGPFSRLGQFLDDAIDEQEQTSDLDTPGLSITEISVKAVGASEPAQVTDSPTTCNQIKKNKKTRAHFTDSTVVSEKGLRFLGKTKDIRKDHNSNFQHDGYNSETSHKVSHPHNESSKVDNFQHIFHHLLASPGLLTLESDTH